MYAPSFVQSAPHQPKKTYVNNPLKTSEISKLLKSKKILKRPASLFFSRFSLKQHIAAKNWWSQTGSNRRPPACKAGALPAELWPPDLSFLRLALLRFLLSRSCMHLYTSSFAKTAPRQPQKILRQNPFEFLKGWSFFGNQGGADRRLVC